MKNIIFKISLLLLLSMLITGCNNSIITNYQNTSETFEIVEIKLPLNFPRELNFEQYGNIKFIYEDRNNIELTFNQKILKNNYVLGYLECGTFHCIKNEYNNDEYIFLKYEVKENVMTISSENNYFPGAIASIYIPNNLKSTNHISLKDEYLFVFSHNKLNDLDLDNFSNVFLDRDLQSIIQVKSKNDGKNVAFVNKNSVKMYSDEFMENEVLNLCRGESLIIKSTDNGISYVEIQFPIEYNKDMFNKKLNIEKHDNYYLVKGFVKYENLLAVPEPLNDDVYYILKWTDYSHDDYVASFTIFSQFYGYYEFNIGENIEIIEAKDVQMLESLIPYTWDMYVIGDQYWSAYSENGNLIAKTDILAHKPHYLWTVKEYEVYQKAYRKYSNYIEEKLKNHIMIDELEQYKSSIIRQESAYKKLQEIWVDWGYINKVKEKDYVFMEILKRFDLTDEEILNIKDMFDKCDELYSEVIETEPDRLFDSKLIQFMNDYISLDFGIIQEIWESIRVKYNSISTVGEENNTDISMENTDRDFVDSFLTFGTITEIAEDYSYIKFTDDENENFTVILTDNNKYGPTMSVGSRIKINCYKDEKGNLFSDGTSLINLD